MNLDNKKIHFIGCGGVGMSALALFLKRRGHVVSGSDERESTYTEVLKKNGVLVFKGHSEKNVGDGDILVYSSAIAKNNPELVYGQGQGLDILSRGELLAAITQAFRSLVVAGTHGKTTTTAMCAGIWLDAGLDPTILVGGKMKQILGNSHSGKGDWIVAESDESDGSFLQLSPEISIVTNIDFDHMEYYKKKESLLEAFRKFGSQTRKKIIACGDDEFVQKSLSGLENVIFYGFKDSNDFKIHRSKNTISLITKSEKVISFDWLVPGDHNALNGAAACVAALFAGISPSTISKGIQKFEGVERRFQLVGERNDVLFFDDYAHHPTEIQCTLQAFREKFPDRRLIVVYQPHRFSRTQYCWDDLKKCFSQADFLFLTDIYPASEAPIAGVNSFELQKQIVNPRSELIGDVFKNLGRIQNFIQSQDVVISMGAGDINKLCPLLAKPSQ